MSDIVNFSTIISRFKENNLHYETLLTPSDMKFILLERGGRILGPFWDTGKSSLFWVTPLFNDPKRFSDFIENKGWNIGGDRVWIAPEFQFNITNRYDFDGTYSLPPQMDPGTYHLTKENSKIFKFENSITLEANTIPSRKTNLFLTSFVTLCDDPLRNVQEYKEISTQVKFAGYERLIILDKKQNDNVMSESWNLVQLIPGGKMIIPTSHLTHPIFYRGKLDSKSFQLCSHAIIIQMDGKNQYKFGVKSPFVFGRIGYYNQIDDDISYLLIKNFYNNPSSTYCEEPPLQPGEHGFSIHVYNDDGNLGGFCEMEVNGQTIGGNTQKTKSSDSILLWAYIGRKWAINKIAEWLLGVTPLQ